MALHSPSNTLTPGEPVSTYIDIVFNQSLYPFLIAHSPPKNEKMDQLFCHCIIIFLALYK